MRYFLAGVNGSGKTTFLKKLAEIRPDIETIKGSQSLMEFLGIPGDYEALRALPKDYAQQKLDEMLEKLLETKENFIFDAHYLNLVRGEVKKVISPVIGKFDALLLRQVPTEIILERIKADHSIRDRALFPEGLNEEEQFKMLNDYVNQYGELHEDLALEYNLPAKILTGEVDEAVQSFLEFDKNLSNH
jgi:adenylate kinase